MSKRKRFGDVRSAGNSRLSPFIPGESPAARHERRKNTAQATQDYLEAWCNDHGLTLVITNHGHHWRILDGEKTFCQWWPSSAKCIIGRTRDGKLPRSIWKSGIHVHDWRQLVKLLTPIIEQTLSER